MTLITATATATGSSTASALVFALVLGAGYLAACVIWPFCACRHCGGTGRFVSPTGRAWRSCPHCAGTGAKLRLGRRIYNHLKHTQDRDRTRRPR
ncbi:hypothetical protein [Actinoallomurus iriomotensis]|uniref:Uncharacterized protein n=1 Tax=Actinoallomurus iriomotensis TaxID=478107 RepID=A0A9W6VVP9_9ACTN|nr:hypothetical protein [Actinoallomurus iriomotensis]GLY82025.1 hypothetical protein Airi01_102920 [Actinoallomurus iriomotensis]